MRTAASGQNLQAGVLQQNQWMSPGEHADRAEVSMKQVTALDVFCRAALESRHSSCSCFCIFYCAVLATSVGSQMVFL